MNTRLSTVAPDLVKQVGEVRDATVLRKIAYKAADMAVKQADLAHPTVDRALALLRDEILGSETERTDILKLVDALDDAYFALQERAEQGGADEADVLVAFSRARAASAVAFALDSDPLHSALEGLYEAQAAGCTIGSLRSAVR